MTVLRFPTRLTSLAAILLCAVLSTYLFSGCDETDGPVNVLHPETVISEISITPDSIHFDDDTEIMDTLVTFQISAVSDLPEDYVLVASLASARDRSELTRDTLTATSDTPRQYHGALSREMRTNNFENFVIYVYPVGPYNRSYDRSEASIPVRGVDTGEPKVLEIDHPETVIIPMPGDPDNRFFISAKVKHTISPDNIARVQLELYNQDDDRIFASNMSDSNPDFGNEPGDSVYVQNFSINSGNNPDTYTIKVHAIDIAGTVSDTLSSTLTIAR